MARVEMGCRRGRDFVFLRWSSNGASFCGAWVPETFSDVSLTRRVASHAHARGRGRGALGRVKTIFCPYPPAFGAAVGTEIPSYGRLGGRESDFVLFPDGVTNQFVQIQKLTEIARFKVRALDRQK